MKFNTKKVQAMGKALAEEMKRCGFSADDNLYEVENTLRELQRQVGLAGMAEFLEEVDDELHEEVKKKASENDFYFHSYRPAVIWSVFGKIRWLMSKKCAF